MGKQNNLLTILSALCYKKQMSDSGNERRLPFGWDAIMKNARADATLGPQEIHRIVEELLALSRERRAEKDARKEPREA